MKKIYTLLFLFLGFFAKGQELLKDITTSNASSHPRYMVETANGTKFFIAKGIGGGTPELWKTDGTSTGTSMVANYFTLPNGGPWIEPYSTLDFGAIGNKIVFPAYAYTSNRACS